MFCTICGFDGFIPSEYRSEADRARALECGRCHAIVPHQSVATTDEELVIIRHAIAIRDALCREDESGLHDVRRWAR
jgi:hypothetical protein